jgi:hypothetical protein
VCYFQGYRALAPYEQEDIEKRFTALKDNVHLLERDLELLQAKHAGVERCFVACRIERDDLKKEVR